jgi:tRNA 2-thiouridine synthesizing protein A
MDESLGSVVGWQVDCRSMPPPFPLLGARAAMALMRPGEILRLLATEPEAAVDVPAWCRMTGNPLLEQGTRRGVHLFIIRKGPGGGPNDGRRIGKSRIQVLDVREPGEFEGGFTAWKEKGLPVER